MRSILSWFSVLTRKNKKHRLALISMWRLVREMIQASTLGIIGVYGIVGVPFFLYLLFRFTMDNASYNKLIFLGLWTVAGGIIGEVWILVAYMSSSIVLLIASSGLITIPLIVLFVLYDIAIIRKGYTS